MANKNKKDVTTYDDGKGGKWVKDNNSNTRVHIDKKGNANIFDDKKHKK